MEGLRALHCWTGLRDQYEWGSAEWAATFETGDATCMLERGHEGPHAFTPDSEIGVSFP